MSVIQIIGLISGLLVFLYCMWMSGYIYVRTLRTLTFLGGMPKKNATQFSVTKASGKLKRIIILEEYRSYFFEDRGEMSEGGRIIEVTDMKGNLILLLDEDISADSVHIFDGGRYYLTIYLKKATGNVDLKWLEV